MKDPEIEILDKQLLSDKWYLLNKYRFKYSRNNRSQVQMREVYDRGDGAAILLYNLETRRVILTRQFRLPSYLNRNSSGMLIEVCAGLLDGDDPEVCARRECLEETGYKLDKLEKVTESYMSPGAITEILHLYVAEFTDSMKQTIGGGLDSEQEDIEVMDMDFDEAFSYVLNGKIRDAKTIILLQYLKLNKFRE